MATVISSIDGCEYRTSSKVIYLKSVPAETYIKNRGLCEKSYETRWCCSDQWWCSFQFSVCHFCIDDF